MHPLDLVLRNARIAGRSAETFDIAIADGKIAEIGSISTDAPAQDVGGRLVMPGFVETHWHMWGAVARNMAGPTENTGYFYISRLLGQFFTPEDNARGVRLALAEAISSGITTVTITVPR